MSCDGGRSGELIFSGITRFVLYTTSDLSLENAALLGIALLGRFVDI